jgi:YidC/Oxa1 family membrane protein insertase
MTPKDPNEKPNFLDRGTLLAVGMILVVWFGWAKYMEIKYPPAPATVAGQAPGAAAAPGAPNAAAGTTTAAPGTTAAPSAAAVPGQPTAQGTAVAEKTLAYKDEFFSFDLSSKGMGLRDVDIKKFQTRTGGPILLGGVKGDYPFATNLVESGLPIDFTMEQKDPTTFVGHATVGGLQFEKTMRVLPGKYAIETDVKLTGNFEGFKGISTSMSEQSLPMESGGFMSSSTNEHQDWFLRHDGTTKTRKAISPKDGLQLSQGNVSIASLSSHYFALATVDHSDLSPKFDTSVAPQAPMIVGRLSYVPVSRPETFNVKYTAFAGPKSFELLGSVDENLSQVVDYGMFGILGKPILWLLKFLQGFIGNWGLSIIALTIIVRLIVLPFNAYSYKSMKAMQRIQPEMNRIKERYKDKPADQKIQMNQEVMALMKANKASPVGGCLPTLLQLPVFFALYQVLGQSIELYRQPFMFWIHDLSARDPFFVLPVLMGITMFVQQKITPTTMDPQQAKILQWMPVLFSFFMLSLPSGLTLYIFVSTLFGICQQYVFMRDKRAAQRQVKEAKA